MPALQQSIAASVSKLIPITIGLYVLAAAQAPNDLYWIFRHSPSFDSGVSFSGLDVKTVLLMLMVYVLTTLFGYMLAAEFLAPIKTNRALKLIAAFVIGYTCGLGLLRLITLVTTARLVLPVALSLMAAIAWARLVAFRRRHPGVHVLGGLACPWTTAAVCLCTVLLVLLLLILQVYAHDFLWVGHGPGQYAFYLQTIQHSPTITHFPIIPQHCDELLYTYFLTRGAAAHVQPIVPMWITLALVKTSVTALLYCLFVRLGVGRGLTIAGTAFLMFGAMGINPAKYLMLFDSANPIAYTVHSGRIVGIAMALLLLADLFGDARPLSFAEGISERRTSFGFLFFSLVAVGLATTSISNLSFLILVYGFAYLAISIAPSLRRDPQSPLLDRLLASRPMHLFLIGAAALTPALSYQILEAPFFYLKPTTLAPGLPITVSLAALGLLGTVVAVKWLQELLATPNGWSAFAFSPWARRFGVLLLASCLALCFMGNVFCQNRLCSGALDALHRYDLLTGLRQETPFPILAMKPAKFFCDARETSWNSGHLSYNDYCRDGRCFFGAYGLIYLLALGSYLLLEDKSRENWPAAGSNCGSAESNSHWNLLLLFLVGLIPVLLFHMDFVDNAPRAWIKSRFLEIPVYGILFIFFCSASRGGSPSLKRCICVGAWLGVILPILFTHRLDQWIDNARLLLRLL